MKNLFAPFVAATLLGVAGPGSLWAKVNVVATLPDYASIAETIGGDRVTVTSIARGTEDPHFVDARPSFVRVLNQADVLIEGGLELEVGWLPPLVGAARNSKILADAPGHLNLSTGIPVLSLPTGPVDRSMGDVHPLGDPHFSLDPANGRIMAAAIARTLSAVDGANASYYQANLAKFNARLEVKLAEWTEALKPFKGTKVLTYHKSFNYLLERFGFELVGTIEPKPGIEPSPTHISALIPRAKDQGVKLVIIEPNRSRKTPAYVAESIHARLLVLPASVGGQEKVKDYVGLFDYDVQQILAALKP